MRKVLTICLLLSVIFLSGCKKESVTSYYSIGCVGYVSGTGDSDWEGFKDYMSSIVAYNVIIDFTGESVDENDGKAASFYNEQVSKIDTDKACSYVKGNDKIQYGIVKKNAQDESVLLKSITFTAHGVE